MAFYLAVDAGGTKTDFVIADENRELARVRCGTIKRMRADVATVTHNLDHALAQLAAISGVSLRAITCTCIGAAGESVPLVADWLREAFAQRVSGEFMLVGDVEIALDAAFLGGPGVLVLAGTGSNVAGRAPGGEMVRAGGWGPALSDQGSGHRIGQRALRAIFLALDEQHSTSLLSAVLKFWGLTSIDHLVEYANQIPAPDFSRLTEVVLASALEGDGVALSVLHKEGEALAHLASLVVRRIRQIAERPVWTPSIAFAGSIMENVAPVRDALIMALRRDFPDLVTLPGVVDPIEGALWRARGGAEKQAATDSHAAVSI